MQPREDCGEKSSLESVKVEGGRLMERVRDLIHEGNVRRIVIRQDDHVVAEFPLTLGVIGTAVAPVLAAVGALAALLADCTLEIERATPPEQPDAATVASESGAPRSEEEPTQLAVAEEHSLVEIT